MLPIAGAATVCSLTSRKRFNYRVDRKIAVRTLPPGPQLRSGTFWSAVYPFAGPQVRSPHFTPGRSIYMGVYRR